MFYSSWQILLAGCMLSVIVVPRFFTTVWLINIVVYSIVIFFNHSNGDALFESTSLVTNEIAHFYLFSSSIFYLITYDDKRCVNVTYYSMLLLVGIAAVGTIIVNNVSPGIVRMQSELMEDRMDELNAFYRMGLSNYLLPHSLPVIIPPLIFLIKSSARDEKVKIPAIIFLLFTLVLIYLSGASMSLILGFFALLSFFMAKEGGKSTRFLITIILIMLPFLLIPDIIPSIISLFSSESAEAYQSHFDDMLQYSQSRTLGNTSYRISLYNKSLNEFYNNIFWGTNDKMSGHSVLLDRLGALGLLGIIPLFTILLCFYNFVKKHIDKNAYGFFNYSFVLGILMLFFKGIDDKEMWLMLFVVSPVILYKASRIQIENNDDVGI